MNIPALALTARSLRLTSRAPGTYALRALFLGFTLFCLFFIWTSSGMLGAPGLRLFQVICYLDLFFISLAGASSFATSIAEEKEEGTLGLLRMTDLSPVAILLGKAGGPLINILLLLLAQFPFVLLAVTLGGVSVPQVVAASITIMAYIFLVAGVGVFASTWRKQVNHAQGLCMLSLLLSFIGPPLARAALAELFDEYKWDKNAPIHIITNDSLKWMTDVASTSQLSRISSVAFTGPIVEEGALVNAAGGLFFFLVAWATFDRFNRDDPVVAPARWTLPFRAARRRRSRPRSWTGLWALTWKDFHISHMGYGGLFFRVVVYLLLTLLFAWLTSRTGLQNLNVPELGSAMFAMGIWALVGEASFIAARLFEEEVRWHTLSALALMPHSLARVAYAKLLGSAVPMLPAVVFFCTGIYLAGQTTRHDIYLAFFSDAWGWFWLLEIACFVHLVTFLSLYVKWAALPIALGVTAMFHMFYFGVWGIISMINRIGGGQSTTIFMFGMLSALLLGAAVLFHFRIGARLAQLARD
ncbi:MAG: hypothetical protein NTW19_23340 [Planctomycetota bacterium]|nr:hypothetical protein [Planctomycetota bacterium]